MRGRDVVRQRFQRLNSFRVRFPGLKQPWDSQKKLEWNAESVGYAKRDVVRQRFQRLNSFRVGFPGLKQPWAGIRQRLWRFVSAKRRFVSPQRRFASAKIGRAKTYLLSPGEQLLSRGE